MKSLDRQSLEEQTRLVSRYVAGDLSRSERAEFEAWLVASPELAAEVEMERRLRRGIASAARRGWLKRRVPVVVSNVDRRWQHGHRRERGGRAGHCRRGRRDAGTSVRTIAAHGSAPAPAVVQLCRAPCGLGSVRGLGTSPDVIVLAPRCPERAHHRARCRGAHLRRRLASNSNAPAASRPQTPQYAEYEMELVNRRSSTLAWRSARQAADRPERVLSFTVQNPPRWRAGDYD